MNIGWFYVVVVTIASVPLALFERWGIARFKVGWGEPLPQNTFWGKQLIQKMPWNLVGEVLLTRYHFVMFFVFIPTALTASAIFLKRWAAEPPTTIVGWGLFILACLLGVMELEDFLFFVFSTIVGSPYPHALARFFRGEATWHKGWVTFVWFKLPAYYVIFPFVIASLLAAISKFKL
jgi:hypothetical protein